MEVQKLLLDTANATLFNGKMIGDFIAESGKEHLWQPRSGTVIDTIVIHYTSAINYTPKSPYRLGSILKIFCDYGVSSHYLINRSGKVMELVPPDQKAWHCGGSIMPENDNRRGVNDFSIGVELMATEKSGFTRFQYNALGNLCLALEHGFKCDFIYTGHDQIAGERAVSMGLRKDKKVDPGELFDWVLFKAIIEGYRSKRNAR